MPSLPLLPRVGAGLLFVASCDGVEGGDVDAARAACRELCAIQQQGEGCAPDDACDRACSDDAKGFSDRCLLAAAAYYACAAEVLWACPVAPDRPETEDARCAAEEHAWLVCKVTGDPPPERVEAAGGL